MISTWAKARGVKGIKETSEEGQGVCHSFSEAELWKVWYKTENNNIKGSKSKLKLKYLCDSQVENLVQGV